MSLPQTLQAAAHRRASDAGRHRRRLQLTDLGCVIWSATGAQLVRFGTVNDSLAGSSHEWHAPYWLVTIVLAALWWVVLGAWGTRETSILGYGPEEYKRVVTASLWLFGAIAIVSYVFQLDTARGYVAVALPLGIVTLLGARWVMRAVLVSARSNGKHLRRVLVVGSPAAAAHTGRQLSEHLEAGYLPIAAYLPGYPGAELRTPVRELPVLGYAEDLDSIVSIVERTGVDAVAISGAALPPPVLRQLGWQLAARDVGMIVAPALTDIAGPRIRTQPVAGLPLIHVTTPKLTGGKRVLKRSVDIVASLAILAVLSIPMLLVALAVFVDDPGPVIFRQTRIGRAGKPFQMLKFRSMIVDAEARLKELQRDNEGAGLLFKMKHDPRITRLGRVLRRYSIDELPQLINVLRGEMSLVGPRPPLPSEVAGYDDFAHRRLLVKPGITGLWQVSGRSDLSWEDSIRLDLYYVENWSLTQDFMIVLRTLRAVVGKSGAY
ncbi:sugar transferase [Sinomonas flava]|uniref:sugar transferase n=1 Tax=Sinomonas flava TaxID=496857 RepID=UPI0039A561DE